MECNVIWCVVFWWHKEMFEWLGQKKCYKTKTKTLKQTKKKKEKEKKTKNRMKWKQYAKMMIMLMTSVKEIMLTILFPFPVHVPVSWDSIQFYFSYASIMECWLFNSFSFIINNNHLNQTWMHKPNMNAFTIETSCPLAIVLNSLPYWKFKTKSHNMDAYQSNKTESQNKKINK